MFSNVNRNISYNSKKCDLSGRKMRFADSSILDQCGVDIELPCRRGVILHSVSALAADDECRAFIARLVELAAHERYKFVHLILFAEIDLSPIQTEKISKIQNACDGNVWPTNLQVQVSSIIGLSFCLAKTILHSLPGENKMEVYQQAVASISLSTSERALMLVSLLPTLCAIDALKCVSGDGTKSPEEQFQSLLGSEDERKRMCSKLSSPKPMHQLGEILRASLI
jgi:hypothetical protein